jgi:hypothetical protein
MTPEAGSACRCRKERHDMRKRIAAVTIAQALIWASLMIATSMILDGTDYYAKLSPLFIGGWVCSWLLTRGLTADRRRAGVCGAPSSTDHAG